MLTPSESKLLPNMLQRSYAGYYVELVKMKALVPCDVEDELTGYKGRIIEVVFDPLRIPEVNAKFKANGYKFDENMHVIAVTDGGAILVWGGLNSVFHLKRGERITGAFDEKHLAFQDILDLTERFKIKRKKVEIDDMIAQMKKTYGKK